MAKTQVAYIVRLKVAIGTTRIWVNGAVCSTFELGNQFGERCLQQGYNYEPGCVLGVEEFELEGFKFIISELQVVKLFLLSRELNFSTITPGT